MRLYELFIGLRYLKAKKSQGGISSNTFLSIFIVFLGVFILVVVLSVMNGFQAAIKDKILDIDAHITVQKSYNPYIDPGIRNYDEVIESIKSVKGVESVFPFIQGQALFRSTDEIIPVMIRGIGDRDKIPGDFKKFITDGSMEYTGGPEIFIGREMGQTMGIEIGQYIEIIVPKGKLTATTGLVPGLERFRVIGYFKTGYYDFDTKMVIISLPRARRLFEVGDIVSGIGVKIKDVFKMDMMAIDIAAAAGYEFIGVTAEEKNQNLFYALKLEKLIMMIILFLIIVAAGFTIMGTLVMVVMEKRKAVGVLKSMGARPKSIMIIFVLEGFLIGVIGATLGVLFSVAASLNLDSIIRWIENAINNTMILVYDMFRMGDFSPIRLVPDQVYYIEGIPTQVIPELVVFIAIFAVFLCTIAAIVPAWHASRLRPVETIRYE